MTVNEFVFVSVDDWQGLYKNGKVVFQQHSIPRYIIFNEMALGQPFRLRYIEADPAWLEEEGYLPENLEDVKTLEEESWP